MTEPPREGREQPPTDRTQIHSDLGKTPSPVTASVAPPESDLTGLQLGDFRLLRRLGQGAMADVYLAEQCSLQRQVAVKVLKSRLATDETYVKRFQREARAAAALVHANIVQIHKVGQIGNVYYIVQEYVQGLNLRQWISRNGSPDLKLALLVMRQVAAALAKAAEQRIVHRDIKPENIMLTRNGEVKVADFGLARMLREVEGVDLTEVGVTLGTPLFMSPEQVEGRPLDPRSDIYSFGVTCYQMLAGVPPFSGETALSVALQHLKKQPDPLENHRPDIPAALCRIVHKMLAKAPENRYQSALELLRELRQVQTAHLTDPWPEDLPGWETAEMTSATSGLCNGATQRLDALMKSEAVLEHHRSRWAIWTAAVLVCFLVGGTAAWFVIQEPPLLGSVDHVRSPVPRQETVSQQWLYASRVGTKEAWQSVIDYFGDKSLYWANRAKQKLATLYLHKGNYAEALKIYRELASLDETEAELHAWGLAGECGVLTMQGEYQESAAVYDEFWPVREHLKDRGMREMLDDYVVPENRKHLDGSNEPNPNRSGRPSAS
jgi:serine/threonine-protein kinase